MTERGEGEVLNTDYVVSESSSVVDNRYKEYVLCFGKSRSRIIEVD